VLFVVVVCCLLLLVLVLVVLVVVCTVASRLMPAVLPLFGVRCRHRSLLEVVLWLVVVAARRDIDFGGFGNVDVVTVIVTDFNYCFFIQLVGVGCCL